MAKRGHPKGRRPQTRNPHDAVRVLSITMRPTVQHALDEWARANGFSRSGAIAHLVSANIGLDQNTAESAA